MLDQDENALQGQILYAKSQNLVVCTLMVQTLGSGLNSQILG